MHVSQFLQFSDFSLAGMQHFVQPGIGNHQIRLPAEGLGGIDVQHPFRGRIHDLQFPFRVHRDNSVVHAVQNRFQAVGPPLFFPPELRHLHRLQQRIPDGIAARPQKYRRQTVFQRFRNCLPAADHTKIPFI